MKKVISLITVLSLILILFTGCSSLGAKFADLKEKFGGKALIVRVTKLEDGYVLAKVVQGDSHFDEEDEIFLYFDKVAGSNGTNKVSPSDELTLSYDYAQDVTVNDRTPVIRVEAVSLYTPED